MRKGALGFYSPVFHFLSLSLLLMYCGLMVLLPCLPSLPSYNDCDVHHCHNGTVPLWNCESNKPFFLKLLLPGVFCQSNKKESNTTSFWQLLEVTSSKFDIKMKTSNAQDLTFKPLSQGLGDSHKCQQEIF